MCVKRKAGHSRGGRGHDENVGSGGTRSGRESAPGEDVPERLPADKRKSPQRGDRTILLRNFITVKWPCQGGRVLLPVSKSWRCISKMTDKAYTVCGALKKSSL